VHYLSIQAEEVELSHFDFISHTTVKRGIAEGVNSS